MQETAGCARLAAECSIGARIGPAILLVGRIVSLQQLYEIRERYELYRLRSVCLATRFRFGYLSS